MSKLKVRVGDVVTNDADPDASGVVLFVRTQLGRRSRGVDIELAWSKSGSSWRAVVGPGYFTAAGIHVRPGP